MPSAIGACSWISALGFALLTASIASVHAQASRPGPDTRIAEATRALAAGDADRAFQLGTAYLKDHPADPRVRILLARIHLDRDELDAAYLQLGPALRAHPQNVDVLYYLGLVSGQLAADQFERLTERAPGSARVHQLVAESLEAQDRRAEAEREYEAALAAKPDLVDALLGLAKLKRIRLDCDGAIALYTKAEAVRPTFDGAFGLATCLLRQQDNDAALTRFEQAVERDPKAAVAWVGLGSTMLEAGRSSDAIVRLRRAIELEPGMADAYYILGRAYRVAGDAARSKEAFETAERLRVDPAHRPERPGVPEQR